MRDQAETANKMVVPAENKLLLGQPAENDEEAVHPRITARTRQLSLARARRRAASKIRRTTLQKQRSK